MSNKTPPRPIWLDPAEYPPPLNTKINILTKGGVGIYGNWDPKTCQCWLPLADTPKHIKSKMTGI